MAKHPPPTQHARTINRRKKRLIEILSTDRSTGPVPSDAAQPTPKNTTDPRRMAPPLADKAATVTVVPPRRPANGNNEGRRVEATELTVCEHGLDIVDAPSGRELLPQGLVPAAATKPSPPPSWPWPRKARERGGYHHAICIVQSCRVSCYFAKLGTNT